MRKAVSILIVALVLGLVPLALMGRTQDRDDAKSTKAKQSEKDRDKSRAAVRIVKGPVIEYVGATDAVIAWSTNANSSTVVRYGTSPTALNERAEKPWGGTNHRVKITGLKPNTEYFFRVESEHAQGTGTEAEATTGSFRTTAKKAKGEHYPKVGPGR